MEKTARFQISEGAMRGFVMVMVYREAAKTRFRSFVSVRSGATAMEYALLAAGIAVAIIGGLSFYADSVSEMFVGVAAEVTD